MPWFLFLLASVAIAARAWLKKRERRADRPWLSVVLIGACWLLAATFWPGRFYAEKMLTDLALPLGLVWFSLLVATIVLVIRRGRAGETLLVATACLLLSLAGHHRFGDALIWSLERRSMDDEPLQEEPFDAICVLGGGAWLDVKGRPVLSSAGDRIILAARLFDAGKAPVLVCSGADLQLAPNFPNVAAMSQTVLAQLGVPPHAMMTAGGNTTKSELVALRRLISEQGWTRVGLITSAWHMPRVERLARGADIDFVPLPADFRSSADADLPLWDKVRQFSIIPSAGAVDQTHVGVKEYLAILASR